MCSRLLCSRFVSITALVGAIALALAAPALADCSNHSPVEGETVTCDTNPPNPDPQGIAGAASNVTVNVLSGAAIEAPDFGIDTIDLVDNANLNWTVNNSGSISGGLIGIRLHSGTISNRAGAAISGSGGISLNLSLDPAAATGTIVNAGTITGTSDEAIEAHTTFGQVVDLTLEGTSVLNGDVFVQGDSLIVRLHGENAEDNDFGLFTENVVDFVVADGASWTLSGMLDVVPVNVNTVGSSALTLSGIVAGSGEVSKIGTGTLALTGDNTYQGTTSVEDGVLRVDGSIADSAVTVASAGRLEGSGIVGATTNNGAVAPGDSIGTLTVSGNYTHTGTLEVEIEPGGGADLLDISGAANIAGGTVAVLLVPGDYAPGTRFPILTAAEGVIGAFDNVIQDNPDIPLDLVRDGNTLFLVVPAPPVLTFDPASLAFGEVPVATTSEPMTATLENTGTGPATALQFEAPGAGFEADTTECGTSLAAGASCVVTVIFTPAAAGAVDGTLSVDSAEEATATLALSGGTVTFRYDFAEGATGYFTTTLGLFNPDREASAHVQVRLLPEGGEPIVVSITLAPFGRESVDVNTAVPMETGVAAVVTSDRPIAPLRQMSWDATTFGSTLESGAPGPSRTHYFAEGATTLWELFYLLSNDNDTPARVTVEYLRDDGARIPQALTVAAHSRQTVWVNAVPGMENAQAGAIITSDVPIAAERSMYFTAGDAPWSAGASSRGAHAPDDTWYFAEGSTNFFDSFLLLMNPDPTAPATVDVRYHLTSGQTITKRHVVPPQARRTILVETEDLALANQLMAAMTVSSEVPVVAERATWWGPTAVSWYESTASVGSPEPGTVWAIGEAWTGGPMAEDTYVLLANAAAEPGAVRVTLVYDDGSTEVREFALAGHGRTTLLLSDLFPASADRRFSVLVESLGANAVPIVVDVSRFQSTGGRFGNAGGSTTATRVP
ncbi:MAG: choice-of-anchor D domain-containing protein [Vicinamibacteraceae bacterium]